MILGVPLLGL
jgi:hypothetical protein